MQSSPFNDVAEKVMSRVLLFLTSIPILVLPLAAGDVWDEYGDPSELKGLKTIYVDTGEYLDVRKLVIEELKKAIPDIAVTPGADGAELALVYVPVVKGDDLRTTLYVLRPVAGKIRLLDRHEDWSTHMGETGFKRTSRVVTRRFIEAYRKAQ